MKKRTALVVLTLLLMGPITNTGLAQSEPRSAADSKNLAGSWAVTGQTALQGTFYALMTFNSDGTVIADEPSAYETAGHGAWQEIGHGQIGYTFVALIGSSTGAFTGSIKVVGTLQLDSNHRGWTGPFRVEVFDPNGTLVFSDNGTFKGSPVKVEAL